MRCPVCRADNDAAAICRRCKADLSLLLTIDEQREQAAARAWRNAGQTFAFDAFSAASAAHECRADQESWRLLAVTHLLKRDFAAAWRCYRAAMQSSQ